MKYLRLVGLIIFVILLLRLDIPAIADVLSAVRWPFLFLAIILNGVLIGVKAWRWRFLLRLQNQSYALGRATVVYFSSLFVGYLTPGRLGEFVKVLYLSEDTAMPKSKAMSTVLTDRLFDLYALLTCGGFGLLVFSDMIQIPFVLQAVVIVAVFASVLFVHPRIQTWVYWALERFPWGQQYIARLRETLQRFYVGMAELWNVQLLWAVLLTSVAYFVYFLQCYLLTRALHLQLGFDFVTFAVATTSLVTLLPVSISGLGTRDAILIALFRPVGLGAEVAVAYSTLMFVTFYIAAGLIGALAWWAFPLDFGLAQVFTLKAQQ